MGNTLENNKVRIELIKTMGEELGILFYHLRNRLMECFFLWNDFKYLFVDKKERVELLNKCAPGFFYNVQRIFRDKVILDLCKLADPAFYKKDVNVTYARVLELVNEILKQDLELKNVQLKNLIQELKHHRNKRITHNDLIVAEKIHKKELLSIPIIAIDKVFVCIQEQFNMIIFHYQNAKTPFRFMEEQTSIRSLINILYDGLETTKKRQERFKNEQYDEDDLKRLNLEL